MGEIGATESIKMAGGSEVLPPFAVGQAVRGEQLEVAHKGLLPGSRRMQLAVDVMRAANERGEEASIKALDMLTYFSDFTEGAVTRSSRVVLLEAAQSKWENGKGWRTIIDRLYAFAGACLPEHRVRDDIAAQDEPTGSVVTAGMVAGNAFYFIERVIPTGVGRNTVRRLEVMSAAHPGCIAAINEYSYAERMAASKVLDDAEATPTEKEAVLSIANRSITQTTEQLLQLLDLERGGEEKTRGWLSRLVGISSIKV